MLFLDFHLAENGLTFPSTAQYLHFIFSRKSPFARKLMTSLLIRAGNFIPSKYSGSELVQEGQSYIYHICLPEYEKFVIQIHDSLARNKFDLSKFVPAHYRRTNRQFKLSKEDIKQQTTQQQAIDCTFFQDDLFSEIDDTVLRKRYNIYANIFSSELSGLKSFDYKDISYRRFHLLQNIKREYQDIFFSKSIFKYKADINTAALSSIISFIEQTSEVDVELTFPIIFEYMSDKDKYRKNISKLFGVDEAKAKKIFAHLSNKGIISFSNFTSWRDLIEDDIVGSKTMSARKDIWLMQFYEEIKYMWKLAKSSANKSGLVPFTVTDKNKFDLYFWLERQIIECAEEMLKARNNKYFLLHDGWISAKEINPKEIEQAIYLKTGLHIKIDIKQQTTQQQAIDCTFPGHI